MTTTDETKATHVITVTAPGIQAAFRVCIDENDFEAFAERFRDRDGGVQVEDPDDGSTAFVFLPRDGAVVVKFWKAADYRKAMLQAQLEAQRQAGAQRFGVQ